MLKKINYAFITLLLFYISSSKAIEMTMDKLHQFTNVNSQVVLINNRFERDIYNSIASDVEFTNLWNLRIEDEDINYYHTEEKYDKNGFFYTGRGDVYRYYYEMDVGSKWRWEINRIIDKDGNADNELIANHETTYLGNTDGCPTTWADGDCETVTGISVWLTHECIGEGTYSFSVSYNGVKFDEKEFSPTRFRPYIYDAFVQYEAIAPELIGDTFSPNNAMSTIDGGVTYIRTAVGGKAGANDQCLAAISGATVRLTNTISPRSGGHSHFTDKKEIGTGFYTKLLPGEILNPDTNEDMTRDTVIEGTTEENANFFALYSAGDFGVEEIITFEVTRKETDTDPELIAEPVPRKLKIQTPNLVELPEGFALNEFYFVYGGTCFHNPAAKWVIPEFKRRLEKFDALYNETFGAHLSFNDASLKFGGRFDNKVTIGGGRDKLCHGSHRRGIDIDINQWDEIGENIYEKKYRNKRRYEFVIFLANKAGLIKVPEKGSIHFRFVNY